MKDENGRLKRMVADQALDIEMLKEVARACRAIGQSRSTQRRPPRPVLAPEQQLRFRLREISRDWPRFGYRFAHGLLRHKGWMVNRKRVQRLWREQVLRVRPYAEFFASLCAAPVLLEFWHVHSSYR